MFVWGGVYQFLVREYELQSVFTGNIPSFVDEGVLDKTCFVTIGILVNISIVLFYFLNNPIISFIAHVGYSGFMQSYVIAG